MVLVSVLYISHMGHCSYVLEGICYWLLAFAFQVEPIVTSLLFEHCLVLVTTRMYLHSQGAVAVRRVVTAAYGD